MKTKIISLLIVLSIGFASCASFVPDYYKLQINDGTYLKIDKTKTETIYELVVGGKYIFLGTWAELKQALKTFAKDVLQALFEIITKYIFDGEGGSGAGVLKDEKYELTQIYNSTSKQLSFYEGGLRLDDRPTRIVVYDSLKDKYAYKIVPAYEVMSDFKLIPRTEP